MWEDIKPTHKQDRRKLFRYCVRNVFNTFLKKKKSASHTYESILKREFDRFHFTTVSITF